MNLLPRDLHARVVAFAEEVLAEIPQVRALRHRLVLVVGPRGAGKTRCLAEVAERADACERINVGAELSRRLLDLTERDRPLRADELLRRVIGDGNDPALLDNIEVLFEPTLQADPLALLQSVSRDRTVVAAWPGSVSDGWLDHAEPGHAAHWRYPSAGVRVVALDPPPDW